MSWRVRLSRRVGIEEGIYLCIPTVAASVDFYLNLILDKTSVMIYYCLELDMRMVLILNLIRRGLKPQNMQ